MSRSKVALLKRLVPKPARILLLLLRDKTRSLVKRAGHALGFGRMIWKFGLPSEIKFWDDYLASRGKSCNAAAEFDFRISPDSELQPWLREWLACPDGAALRAVDVGAGPLTWLGKKWGSRQISIEAIDPLAEAYDHLMERYGINPPVRTKQGEGEEIAGRFGREVFDLAFARNCLDHACDAIQAVTSMVAVTKPGGVIFLWHSPDEAEHMKYQGLHQWNFRLLKGELIVCKGGKMLNVNRAFAGQLKALRCELKDGMIEAVYRKLPFTP